MSNLVTRKIVLETLHIHYQTLRNMVIRNDIQVVSFGNKYLYNLDKYLLDNKIDKITNNNFIVKRVNICYCRVSSKKQYLDLERQIQFMKLKYPNHQLISEIGSGINYKRKGLTKIIDLAIEGKINELVIAYKDRLARIGYELIEHIIITHSKGKIIIVNKLEEQTPTEELVKDVISIMNVYVAKINGLRKYTSKIEKEIVTHKYI